MTVSKQAKASLLSLVIAALTVSGLLASLLGLATPRAGAQTLALPDLVADAPKPILTEVVGANGTSPGQLLVRFDGYVTNLGDGPLEISGNPQLSNPNDLTSHNAPQRALIAGTDRTNPNNWVTVGTPPVKYEDADGHNHFHLMEVGRYSLWNANQTGEAAPGNKIGFCLYDSEGTQGRHANPGPQTYNFNVVRFCQVNNPTATDLTMGTTEGWRDRYGSNLFFQWVDASNTSPGDYWLASEADPFNRIVEADENNNQINFATNKTVIPGYVAQPITTNATGPKNIQLQRTSFGAPGQARYTITTPPSHGTLSVSTGTSFTNQTITYTPNNGYTGPDSFDYQVRDASSAFPLHAPTASVTINVGGSSAASVAISGAPSTVWTTTSVELSAAVTNCGGQAVTWAVNGLNGGNANLGFISNTGQYTAPVNVPNPSTVNIRATSNACGVNDVITINLVDSNGAPAIEQVGFQNSAAGTYAVTTLSAFDVDGDTLTWSATGLPNNVNINTSTGRITGTPNVPGIYNVNVTASDGTQSDTMSYTWDVWNPAPDVSGVLATGDFDGDGRADAAIGVPGEDAGASNSGAVSVVYGSGSGLTGTGDQFWRQASNGLGGIAEAGDRFGSAVAAGDFNGDGRDDLAIGAPDEDVNGSANAGAVTVLYGTDNGLVAGGHDILSQMGAVAGNVEANDRFGASLATGDFNNDGRDDLAIGAPGEDIGSINSAGYVNIIYGSPTGLVLAGNVGFSQGNVAGIAESGDEFGTALAAGDINNDGRDDLVVGVPGEDWGSLSNAGVINVLYGSNSGITLANNHFMSQNGPVAGVLEAGDEFGAALAVADLSGDGFADVVVGAPGEAIGPLNNAGAINVLLGSSGGLTTNGNYFSQDGPTVGIPEAGDRFGASISAGRINGDVRYDVIIGAPGEDIGALGDVGMAHVLYGHWNTGLTTVNNQGLIPGSGGTGAAEPGDAFGGAVLLGDFDGNNRADALIGAPGENVGNIADAGFAAQIMSTGSAIGTSGSFIIQGGAYADSPEAGDNFG